MMLLLSKIKNNFRIIIRLFILLIIIFILIDSPKDPAEITSKSPPKQSIKPSLTVEWLNPYLTQWQLKTIADGRIAEWQEAKVSTQTNGLVITKVLVNVGDQVKKGQALVEFDNKIIQTELAQLNASVKEAQANYEEARRNHVRGTHLRKENAISDMEYHNLKALMLSTKSRLESAKAAQVNGQVRFKQTQLVAPDDGVISARHASIGAVANAGDELFKMIVQNRLEWQAEVVAQNLKQIAVGQEASVTLTDGQQIKGIVRKISPAIDPIKNTAIVYVDLNETSSTRSGIFVKGHFIRDSESFLTLPQSAVIMSDGFHYVFKILEDNSVQQIKVTIGHRQDDQIAILSGISEKDKLVLTGVSFLKDGDIVNVATRNSIKEKK